MDPLVSFARDTLDRGSRSFAAAARLLPAETRDSAALLYACCRHCDDVVDGQALGFDAMSVGADTPVERLDRLEADIRRALHGGPAEAPVMQALQRVVRRHHIPERRVFELLAGFRMDVAGRCYAELADTLDYAYHVAGVVGVMMALVMGVRDEDALDRASDLGIAMQLTNIARDVVEDAAMGRCYLPARWLVEAGLDQGSLTAPENRRRLASVTARLLAEAEAYYASGTAGLAALRFREAWAIAAARSVYRQIGVEVRRRGPDAWRQRVTIGRTRKLGLLATALLTSLATRRQAPPARSGLWHRPGRRPEDAWRDRADGALAGTGSPLTG